MLQDKKIFFLDCDGTLALGDVPFKETRDFLQALKDKNKIFYILTNNSSKTPAQHLAKFSKLELPLTEANVLVSTKSALAYLKQNNLNNIFWLANESVSQYIKSSGFMQTEDNPQALLLTYDDKLNYDKLTKFISQVRKNIPYFATHGDILCPDPAGYLPDIGTFIKLIEMSTGCLPVKIFGKPNKDFIDPILKSHDLTYKDSVIIGDRLYTDIKMAENSEITSILVLTGETSMTDYHNSPIKSNLVVENLTQLLTYL